MRRVIYNQEDFSKIDYYIRKAIFEFIRCAEMNLVDEDFDHFWFKIDLVDDNMLLVYLLYKPIEDERILTWHIYLQTRLNEFIEESEVDLGDLKIAFIVECEDLWNK